MKNILTMSLKSYKKIIEQQQERDRRSGSPEGVRNTGHEDSFDHYRPGVSDSYDEPEEPVLVDEVYYEEVSPEEAREAERQRRHSGRSRRPDYDGQRDYYEYPREKRRRGIGCGAWILILIVALLVVAAATNPSQYEARQLIKEQTLDYVDLAIKQKVQQELNSDGLAAMASMLGMAVAPEIFDYAVDTKVDNFIFFSKFDMSVNIELLGVHQKVVSGIILFGKMIPLETNIPENFTQQDE